MSKKVKEQKKKVVATLDTVLASLQKNPGITKLQIALQIDTGNTIYEEFTDVGKAMEFIKQHSQNPDKILERIKPPEEESKGH